MWGMSPRLGSHEDLYPARSGQAGPAPISQCHGARPEPGPRPGPPCGALAGVSCGFTLTATRTGRCAAGSEDSAAAKPRPSSGHSGCSASRRTPARRGRAASESEKRLPVWSASVSIAGAGSAPAAQAACPSMPKRSLTMPAPGEPTRSSARPRRPRYPQEPAAPSTAPTCRRRSRRAAGGRRRPPPSRPRRAAAAGSPASARRLEAAAAARVQGGPGWDRPARGGRAGVPDRERDQQADRNRIDSSEPARKCLRTGSRPWRPPSQVVAAARLGGRYGVGLQPAVEADQHGDRVRDRSGHPHHPAGDLLVGERGDSPGPVRQIGVMRVQRVRARAPA